MTVKSIIKGKESNLFFYCMLIVGKKLKNKECLRKIVTYNPIYHPLKSINVWGYLVSFSLLQISFCQAQALGCSVSTGNTGILVRNINRCPVFTLKPVKSLRLGSGMLIFLKATLLPG